MSGYAKYTPDRRHAMTERIPPEGDDYNKQREVELYASITNKAMLVRRHAEMLRDEAPLEQIAEAVAAMAQMERDIARLSLELHNSTQGKNLNIFLVRFEEAIAENAARMERILKEKGDSDTLILAGVNNNLTLMNLSVERVLVKVQSTNKAVVALRKSLEDVTKKVADLEAWRASLEARGDGD